MKKIGIITICKVNNYGAELQAFATQKKLEQLGYEAEIIDYLYYKNWRFKDTGLSKPFIPLSVTGRLMYWIKYRLIGFVIDILLPVFNMDLRRRQKNYEKFINKGRFSRQYNSMDALYKVKHDYDLYLVGSDQVWNPGASSSIEPYFLTFAPTEALKVAYASSFGVSLIPHDLQEQYVKLLNSVSIISVREQSGVELVKQLTGRDAQLVLDPTLLMNKKDWEEYMKPVCYIKTPFVLIYQLFSSSSLREVALRIGYEKGIPVYRLCKRAYGVRKYKGVINILDAGPSEFLWLIKHAACVITDSFHGTAFSVNFTTPFCCILNRNRKNNGRMISLLNKLNLNEHIVYEDSIDELDINIINSDVNNAKLEELRKESITFIQNALQ